ncbi:myocyte-specific enhancer factor 2B [Xiphias gladius]|uniref:myocyte-specific enhancer factor 2B n=1 Tax=Xiphias gladius TaxID=8245 RepID=UPI001A988605|nr:myocyte-specific enhancer factor 2B [Xiphias gladius]XP_039984799.1 myocyte-specific enhancer factor 2B [Xiphias gladius]XP_039984800.1 myocyte-specific enhancer factor 2B [Xiphias gladius]
MGRKKIQISRILDQRNRQVTFTKRKFGLMKKAYELSVLCDCEIALIIFNSTNRLFQYASTDMDKVLLKYTEYSEPHESRTNTDILETLRRKGLGLDGSELDNEESMQVATDKYPLSEGMDLSVARQRFHAPSLLSPEAQFLVSSGCENGFPNSSGSSMASQRPPVFKSISSRPGSASPAAPHAHTAFMSPNSGIGYSMFSHGNLNRALDMKNPPPLSLGSENLRGDAPSQAMATTRANHNSARGLLYQGLHSSNSMVTMGKTGLLGHSLGGYGLPSPGASEYSHPGFYHSVSLQRGALNPWQAAQQPQEPHGPHLSPGMSSGGCSFPSQSCSSTSPHLPSLSLSIKSERRSPEHMSSPTSPPLQHLRQHSPMSDPDSACHTPPETRPANEAKEFPKAGYPQNEEEGGPPLRQLEMSDGWQR